jgi:hypothetical protein
MKELDQLLSSFEQMLRICLEALSPTATQRQRADARAMLKDYFDSKAKK